MGFSEKQAIPTNTRIQPTTTGRSHAKPKARAASTGSRNAKPKARAASTGQPYFLAVSVFSAGSTFTCPYK
jgi:hypothetical protein